MRIGAYATFGRLDDLDERFEGVDFPVELALPHRPERFELILSHLDAVAAFVESRGIEVLTIQAPEVSISDPNALTWLLPVCKFADGLGVGNVTVHPEKCKDDKEKESKRESFLRNLGVAADTYGGTLSVETFAEDFWLPSRQEIVESELPMTLDVPLVGSAEETRGLIRNYLPRIATVHLSSWSEDERHLPLDEESAVLALLLKGIGFEGNVILEYKPWHWYRVRGDITRLTNIIETGEVRPFPPIDDKYREDKSMWKFK
ncbi:MAG: hypothetical protein E3J72_16590 [Planctomycetota bacterium]|nr:MAG: hypothetical protein E3J72_16590 [Planctomycetota bacterium]